MSNIFDEIASYQTMQFADNYETNFNVLEKYFPTQRTTAEYIKVLDYDVEYNPTALAVADNTIAPLADIPGASTAIQDMFTFKLEYRLTDAQLRKLQTASTSAEIQELIKQIFTLEKNLLDAQYIARERVRGQALLGKIEINENGFHPDPVDYEIPEEQQIDIDLTTDDFIEEVYKVKNGMLDTYGKSLSRMICSRESIIKLGANETLRKQVLGSTDGEDRRLTIAETISALQDYLEITVEIIEDGDGSNYVYTDIQNAQHLFLPKDKIILIPNMTLGATPVGVTAEELDLQSTEGITLKNDNGITIFSNYEKRPVNYVLTSVSRFCVVYPKAYYSVVLTDTSDPLTFKK